MRSIRKCAPIAMAAAAALALAACGGSGSAGSTSSSGHVTMTWWTNATAGDLKIVWQQAANAYHAAHPNVTIQVDPIQNEAFTTKVPAALASNNPPDIYQQWGGGQEASQIPSGKITDLSPLVSSWIGQTGAAAQGWQVGGKQSRSVMAARWPSSSSSSASYSRCCTSASCCAVTPAAP